MGGCCTAKRGRDKGRSLALCSPTSTFITCSMSGFETVVKPRLKGEAYEIRFADDFILCFQYREDAEKVLDVLRKRFEKFGVRTDAASG